MTRSPIISEQISTLNSPPDIDISLHLITSQLSLIYIYLRTLQWHNKGKLYRELLGSVEQLPEAAPFHGTRETDRCSPLRPAQTTIAGTWGIFVLVLSVRARLPYNKPNFFVTSRLRRCNYYTLVHFLLLNLGVVPQLSYAYWITIKLSRYAMTKNYVWNFNGRNNREKWVI